MTKLDVLKKAQEQAAYNLLCYSKTYGMDTPKDGQEANWQAAKEELAILDAMIADMAPAADGDTIKNMGTNMSQADYEKLCGKSDEWKLSNAEAILLVNGEFGFEASRINIIEDVETFKKEGNYAVPNEKYVRTPQNCSTDWNYVRFDVNGWQFEMVNGSLKPYFN